MKFETGLKASDTAEKAAVCRLTSPVGMLELHADESGLRSLQFLNEPSVLASEPSSSLAECAKQLAEYFEGTRKTFDIPLNPDGTDFQKRVWSELLKIEYGITISYQELADRLGDPKVVRAVGGANGKNPIGIIVPCHRVIGAGGKLVGYGGGIERKKWLLKHEQSFAKRSDMLF
jgi:methylated-DNA-[protein]-cysteine S-methyltransferase